MVAKPGTQDGSDSDTDDSIEDGNQTGENSNERNNDETVAHIIGPVEATAAVQQLEEQSKAVHEHALNACATPMNSYNSHIMMQSLVLHTVTDHLLCC